MGFGIWALADTKQQHLYLMTESISSPPHIERWQPPLKVNPSATIFFQSLPRYFFASIFALFKNPIYTPTNGLHCQKNISECISLTKIFGPLKSSYVLLRAHLYFCLKFETLEGDIERALCERVLKIINP